MRDDPSVAGRSSRLIRVATMIAPLLLGGGVARADIILTPTVDAFSGNDIEDGSNPTGQIGLFSWVAPGGHYYLASATITGNWGYNFVSPDSAPANLLVGGITVASCAVPNPVTNSAPDCYASDTQTPWSYIFTASDIATALQGSSVEFDFAQLGNGQVQVDQTTLSLDFVLPEPASVALFGVAVAALGVVKRRNRK